MFKVSVCTGHHVYFAVFSITAAVFSGSWGSLYPFCPTASTESEKKFVDALTNILLMKTMYNTGYIVSNIMITKYGDRWVSRHIGVITL